ncbi:hypothetical protein [Methylocaldum sp.]|uniref:hypothetical protein n=1 Tax=Methylocaldum sp. TaxID=1969727 RepID=UPI002D5F8875|nr:hypothetical protein [Methylocaldum sp.]HYE38258.1 hypothetical protein [Methylocaldum sp.]
MQMVRRGSFLAPVAPLDSDQLSKLPVGKPLAVRVTRARSVPQLRLYWSMLGLVAENLDQPITDDDLHEWVKGKLGYAAPVKQRNGEVVNVTRSIAFDKMDQQSFQAFFDKAKALLVEHIIPGLESEALEREARAMLGEAA